jgi:hypothetical protein
MNWCDEKFNDFIQGLLEIINMQSKKGWSALENGLWEGKNEIIKSDDLSYDDNGNSIMERMVEDYYRE